MNSQTATASSSSLLSDSPGVNNQRWTRSIVEGIPRVVATARERPGQAQSANMDSYDNSSATVTLRPGPDQVFAELPRSVPDARRAESIVLAEWEGSVVEIRHSDIVANLFPIRGVIGEAVAEIPRDEIAPGDLLLVRPGALFRLVIGYEEIGGTRSRFSRIIFRRVPAWSASELEQARITAQQQFDAIPLE